MTFRSPIRYRRTGLAAAALLLTVLLPDALSAQETSSRLRHEFGLWVGASNPMPGTATDEVLDANIGGGGFYRINFPWIFLTELGFSWSQYDSRTEQQLLAFPLYGALVYQLPFSFKVQTFLKVGGGAAWLEVRPSNRSGWDPLFYAGTEFSLLASRRLRIGLRLDYELIYEKNLDQPQNEFQTLGNTDPRFQQNREFTLENGEFFHFGLMVSFIF